MINMSKALMMLFAFLILTEPSYAGNDNLTPNIEDQNNNDIKKNLKNEQTADSNKEKDKPPKDNQGDSSSTKNLRIGAIAK